jgi:serine/threonine protein kinase
VLRDGRYRVLGVLGTGSQAQTLEAEDVHHARLVAIKRFSVRGAASWKEVELAEREARVLSELRHDGLPAYFEHFEEDGALYLVMEKIEGRTLNELRKANALDQAQVLRFLREIAAILRYLHGRSPPIIHRDIKPQNVIQRANGSFALVDFGSVRDQLRPEGGSTVVGTFGYMAPEQFQGRALPASDVYGAGATAIACLAGQDPESLPHKGLSLDVRAALGGRVDSTLVELLAKLVEPDPDKRPADLERALNDVVRPRPFVSPQRAKLRTEAREEERRLRKELRDIRLHRKNERRARKWERRHARTQGFRGPARRGPIAGVLLLSILLLLFFARAVSFALFRVLLPTALHTLSLLFGAGLRRAATQLVEFDRSAELSIQRAAGALRTAAANASGWGQETRFRVEPSPEPEHASERGQGHTAVEAPAHDGSDEQARSSKR